MGPMNPTCWSFRSAARRSLDSLLHHEARRAELELLALAKAVNAYSALAQDLSLLRAKAARKLEKSVVAELAELGMAKAVFEVHLGLKEAEGGLFVLEGQHYQATALGADDVEFMLAANPGEAPKSLAKVASGGELSRITLALKTSLAKGGGAGTLVFDEIDSGISGRVAEIVGEKISALALGQQLLCVTHLPQIASRPARHLQVGKQAQGGSTETTVKLLGAVEREREVAAMLAGKELTQTALKHARELMALAAGEA